ncbi:MAG: bifunctional pyr operon transcriptional regulator/uracil phosphoribosyltransferase PyrR [Deltaproteobacteria bacterium]|nr:bifunctional pyr operon transcriptional regulator/uracil phosphoribosyltransferase PyrR [Deltaproteobacteria bacterium]
MSRVILDGQATQRTLRRLASQMVESVEPGARLALVGVRRGGVPLAERLADLIEEMVGERPDLGAIDITLYRDDLYTGLEKPSFGATELPFLLDGACIVLVDDVLFTGRTVLAALGVLRDYGRPRWVKLAVLVDRGWRELPLQADFVGKTIETARGDKVLVEPDASDGKGRVSVTRESDR